MNRSYYSNDINSFRSDSNEKIVGILCSNHSNANLTDLQINAWTDQITILKDQLIGLPGKIYFEFAIPRMGKRVDTVIIIHDVVFIVEFKVGYSSYEKHSIEQVIDYTIDLKNFHEGSHELKLIPVLVSTNACENINRYSEIYNYRSSAKCNKHNLRDFLSKTVSYENTPINCSCWENSIYKPTPTIIEAAQALYKGHNVKEITRSDSGAINLSQTAESINQIIETSKMSKLKSICFITGVPGAGKTLAGLNIANERMNADENEHAVFLSGNGPLVEVLREALTRDNVESAKENGKAITKTLAEIKSNAFIQNIYHFRNDSLRSKNAPIEKVVVFDEAQRAWNRDKTESFMKRKKGLINFEMSEPEFLISIMDRHQDWCTIICLIGGGQEINTGEAGLEEWIHSLKIHFPHWKTYYSKEIFKKPNYLTRTDLIDWTKNHGILYPNLHLAVSVRSFRSENLSEFIQELLELNLDNSKRLFSSLLHKYPIKLTRNLESAKQWLISKKLGSERIGLIASSGARRLKAVGIDVKNDISASNWFLNNQDDIRSSYYLEDTATEFEIQGLEIDWACIAWGANFYIENDKWNYQKLKGTKWQNINNEAHKKYLINTYRVLLTRARQGMVIFIPTGDNADHTRLTKFYDKTYDFLKKIGIKEI